MSPREQRPARPGARVLVTGGAGYIGSQTVLSLIDAGYQPVVLDNLSTGARDAVPSTVPFFLGDVADQVFVKSIIDQMNIFSVLHFAGSIIVSESVSDPISYYRNNTSKSVDLIESCIYAKVRNFIFSSTAAVYGVPTVTPLNEASETLPVSPYGASKLMTERVLSDTAAANPSFKPICLRYFNVAGADPSGRTGQRGFQATHLIRATLDAAAGIRPYLEVFGNDYSTRDGTCERDFIHVADLAAGHVAALDYLVRGGEAGIFNCGYGRGYSVLEVIACAEQVIGRPIPVRMAPRRPGDPPSVIADSSAAVSVLGWKPKHADLAEIISSAYAWHQKMHA